MQPRKPKVDYSRLAPGSIDAIKAVESIEFKVYQKIERLNQAFLILCNGPSLAQAKEALGDMRTTAADLEKTIRTILNTWQVPPALVTNVSRFTQDTLESKYLNLTQFYLRFLHAQSHQHKCVELTRLYYLIKDVAEISLVTKAERYAREVIQP